MFFFSVMLSTIAWNLYRCHLFACCFCLWYLFHCEMKMKWSWNNKVHTMNINCCDDRIKNHWFSTYKSSRLAKAPVVIHNSLLFAYLLTAELLWVWEVEIKRKKKHLANPRKSFVSVLLSSIVAFDFHVCYGEFALFQMNDNKRKEWRKNFIVLLRFSECSIFLSFT